MRPDPQRPETWLCQVWWPAEWQDHFYADDFVVLREVGMRLLSRPGDWSLFLHAADPVVQFADVQLAGRKVVEVYADSDVPEGSPRRILVTNEREQWSMASVDAAVELIERLGNKEDPTL